MLHGCSHVNKKALDQYTTFTEQREELARRQIENGRGEDKITQLIKTLDMRKDEAIERTFKVVRCLGSPPLGTALFHVALVKLFLLSCLCSDAVLKLPLSVCPYKAAIVKLLLSGFL